MPSKRITFTHRRCPILLETGKEGRCILLYGLWPCDCLLQDEVNFVAFILQDKHAGFLAAYLINTITDGRLS